MMVTNLVNSKNSKRVNTLVRVAGIKGLEEARDVLDAVYRDFPLLRVISTNPRSNLRLMTLIRDFRLLYNQVITILLFFLFIGLISASTFLSSAFFLYPF